MEKNIIRKVNYGDSMRMSYAKIDEVYEMPNLLDLQINSYKWFIDKGLKEVFDDISPIRDYNGKFSLEFVDFELNEKETKYDIPECKERDVNYAAPLRVKVRLKIEDRVIPEQPIFMGDFPIMTETGTFIINGAERVIVSQLVRSPGIYYAIEKDKDGKNLLSSTVIPNRGAWLEYETDSANIFSVRVDRTRKVPVTTLIRALDPGLNAENDIIEKFGADPKIIATLNKDEKDQTYESALIELYKKIRPGEVPTVESSKSLLHNMFYDSKRYDLAHVGRYKFNKKLALRRRVAGYTLAEDAIDPMTGDVIVYFNEKGEPVNMEKGTKLTQDMCDAIQDTGAEYVWVQLKEDLRVDVHEDDKVTRVKVLTNKTVKIDEFIAKFDFDPVLERVPSSERHNMEETLKKLRSERVYYPMLVEVLEEAGDDAELFLNIAKANITELVTKHITIDDIWASINYCMHLDYGIGFKDDIDHLGNRRIRCVGELLQNQFRIGLTKMERGIREKMNIQDLDNVTPQNLINIKPVTASIKEFFGSSQLSQFMDQNNPLGELTHKRRLSALGPGGLSRERAGFEVRDVHSSHYGRMCPIETPEGPNIGLINSLANFARINEYGFIETPYRRIDKSGDVPVVTSDVKYYTADEEEVFNIAQANEELDKEGHFVNAKVTCRSGEENVQLPPEQIDLMDVSPRQLVSVATALIPFLQNDDVTRALMGSNMQRQAVPLLVTDSPIVGTGIETKTAKDSGVVIVAKNSGTVVYVDADKVVIKTDGGGRDEYTLTKFKRSNQSNCINQRPIVTKGQHINAGDIIADGPSTYKGELALGKNPLIGFMTWEGYNYEDAVLLSERLVMDDVYTSIHIEEHETEARDNVKLGAEEITRDIPNVGEDALRDLDEEGIIHIGAEVQPNDILVGKVTPKGETELTAEERLLRAIFGEKAREVRDTSLRVPHGESGIIVDVKKFTRANHDELSPGVNELVRVYIAQKRKISVGDKMAGRHGNKGVVSRVLPVEDMPFLPNGRPLDIVLNPLGVPSRMNIGQVLEIHLGLASNVLGWKIATPVFEGANESDIMDSLTMANDYANGTWEDFTAKYKDILDSEVFEYLEQNKDHREEWKGVPIDHTGKVQLRDGRTGEEFDNATTIGFMHYLKLHHLVDDKIHARSTGPYSLVTQQPLGGKAQFGGQRFGEMEVWALEAYGASYTLQEILTVKSDDIVGRVKTYEAIVHGENIPEPGIPESFKVLLKELHALALDVEILNNGEVVELKEDIDDGGVSIIKREKINIEGNEPAEENDKPESETQDEDVSIENVLNAIAADVGDIGDIEEADIDIADDEDMILSADDAELNAELEAEFEAELEKLDKELDVEDEYNDDTE